MVDRGRTSKGKKKEATLMRDALDRLASICRVKKCTKSQSGVRNKSSYRTHEKRGEGRGDEKNPDSTAGGGGSTKI